MIWRVWALIAGAPVGLLGGFVGLGLPPSLPKLVLCGVGGGLVWLLALSMVALARDRDPARGAHLAQAASAGLLALPALAAALLQLGPGGVWLLGLSLAVPLLALARAALTRAPAAGPRRQIRAALAYLAGGALAIAALVGAVSELAAPRPALDASRTAAVLDLDARVVTRPIPRCAARPRGTRVLLERGAHPRLSEGGDVLWLDARSEAGPRQIYRLERASLREECWTCAEPGDNLRPAPLGEGAGVLFETTRHARWWDPTNSELHLIRGRGARPAEPSQRLTHHPGPDEHPALAPGAGLVVWTRRLRGRFAVVSAPLENARGGIRLGEPTPLVSGGAAWIAAAAWSPDARSLVLLRGNPWGALRAQSFDPATGEWIALGSLRGGGADFDADGGFLGVAGARRAGALGWLPPAAGFLLAPLAGAAEHTGPLAEGSELRLAEPRGEGAALELGPVAEWGAPTGLALAPDGTRLVLGQRRVIAGAFEERLLEVELDCRL